MKTALLIMLLLATTALGQSILPEQAKDNVGKQVRVTGVVSEIKSTASIVYINFGNPYPKNTFTVVIFEKDVAKFKDLKSFEGKRVAVIGVIIEYKGHPEIIVRDPQQIGVIE